MLPKIKRFANQSIRDKDNNLVVWQLPNPPLVGWFVGLIISNVIASGFLKTGLAALSTAFLFTWAYLEVAQGATYLRRLPGVIAMIIAFFAYFR